FSYLNRSPTHCRLWKQLDCHGLLLAVLLVVNTQSSVLSKFPVVWLCHWIDLARTRSESVKNNSGTRFRGAALSGNPVGTCPLSNVSRTKLAQSTVFSPLIQRQRVPSVSFLPGGSSAKCPQSAMARASTAFMVLAERYKALTGLM